jgi:hypothetical protein
MASLSGKDNVGTWVVTLAPVHPAPAEPHHEYHLTVREDSQVILDRVFGLWHYEGGRRFTLGHHWMLYIARVLQSADRLPAAEVPLAGGTIMTAPLSLSGSIDWLRVAVHRDRKYAGLACVTFDVEPAPTPPSEEHRQATYISFAMRCPVEDVVAFGKDLEAEYEVARRKREALGLMAWDELESEPEPAGPGEGGPHRQPGEQAGGRSRCGGPPSLG